ncbi:hypothetical protein PVAND_017444 [Polypedilum vanderplanki]|uniref:Membrane protein BRI3 n=1 Tax=Polypedilum vanderplanki TaxID=319348 RepID=A0A9J6BIA5_POLVA|nr:hypothetical protein PVAND_017444 [Polypedilum vanderplanki]
MRIYKEKQRIFYNSLFSHSLETKNENKPINSISINFDPVVPSVVPPEFFKQSKFENMKNYESINYESDISLPHKLIDEKILIAGADLCPICKNGFVEDEFSTFGICFALLLFPIGVSYCMLNKIRKCTACNAVF